MMMQWPQAMKDELRALWLTPTTVAAIAVKLGCSTDTIYKYARRMNLPKKIRAKQTVWATSWSKHDEDIVRALWGKVSSPLIAAKIGHGITKNGVISKAKRLGLPQLQKGYARGINKVRTPRQPRGCAGSPASLILHRIKNPPRLKVIPVEIPPPEALMIPLLQLNDHTCKYTLGEGTGINQLFCGAPKDIEFSYCPFHHRLAYVPVTPKSVRDAARLAERMAA